MNSVTTNKHTPTVAVAISDIIDTSPRGIRVIIEKTGKAAWLPRRRVEILPGHAILPVWLFKRILHGHYSIKKSMS